MMLGPFQGLVAAIGNLFATVVEEGGRIFGALLEKVWSFLHLVSVGSSVGNGASNVEPHLFHGRQCGQRNCQCLRFGRVVGASGLFHTVAMGRHHGLPGCESPRPRGLPDNFLAAGATGRNYVATGFYRRKIDGAFQRASSARLAFVDSSATVIQFARRKGSVQVIVSQMVVFGYRSCGGDSSPRADTGDPIGQPLPTTGTTESRIGPLAFEGGYPTDATVTKLYDEMDFQRATQAYMWAIPIVSFAKWQEQHEKVFGQEDGDLVQMVSSRDKMGMLTPNDSTTYLIGFWNLERTGPMVIDYPKGLTAGGILDMWQRPITDRA